MSRPELAAFAAALRSEMSRKGLGNDAVAEATGVTRQQVSAWRNGHNAPSAKSVATIEQLLGLERGALFVHLQDVAPDEPPAGAAAASGDVSDLAAMMADIQRELREQRQLIEELRRDREDG